MSLDDIVQVTITAQTAAPSRVGFGIPLVMAYHTNWPERARVYTSVADMITDGFATTDLATLAVGALLAQNPKPSQVVVGRETGTQGISIQIIPVAQDTTLYRVVLAGQNADYTSGASATVAQICTGLKTAIDALSLTGITVTDNTTDIEIDAAAATNNIPVHVDDRTLLQMLDNTVDGSPTIAADIAAVQVENDDWYSCHLTNHGKAVITAAAVYIETLYKIMVVASPDYDIYGSGSSDLASNLQTAGYGRTALMHHPKANSQFPGCAWAGRCLPKDPGSITWKFMTLSGVDYVDYTSTEQGYITAKDCNNYVRIAGISMTQEGVMSSGEFIDVVRGIDFIRARLQEYVFTLLANSDKVPFTNAGIAAVEAEVRAVMELAIGQKILTADPAPVVQAPKASEVSAADKANRLLPDVTFTGTLAGAIHAVQISGTISV
jgi:hypothetical protein